MRHQRILSAPEFETREKDGQMTLIGYAAVWYDGTKETEYRMGDFMIERFRKGAFKRTLKAGEIDVKAKADHVTILGRTGNQTLRLKEDPRGLRYEIDLADTQGSRDLITHIRRRDYPGSSLAFNVDYTGEEFERARGQIPIRWIIDADLHDVGPCSDPAYPGTTVSARKDDQEAEIMRLKKRLAAIKFLDLAADL